MPSPVLYDAVTLRHFGTCGRLDVCEALHAAMPAPRWTEEVHAEITRAAAFGAAGCQDVLSATWLGSPVIPTAADLRKIYNLQVALDSGRRPPASHAGEAQSIHFAQVYGGVFVTDDNAAYDFAEQRLGFGRVMDSVQILREAVVAGNLTSNDAAALAGTIRSNGRFLRRVHPSVLRPSDF